VAARATLFTNIQQYKE